MSKAPPLLLAHVWTPDVDPTGWWMSEKLDGVRAYWDGEKLISRLGNPFATPEWFTKDLPSFPLDGELYAGPKQFQQCVSICRRKEPHDGWKNLRYVAFDAPAMVETYEARYAAIFRLSFSQRFTVIGKDMCHGLQDLKHNLRRVEKRGGEGIMLRQPGSLYEGKRSRTLLKVKSFLDADAIVIGHEPGKGKHVGRLGSLRVAFGDVEFNVGSGFTDAQREAPPPIGSTIEFSYQELSRDGVPRFPVFLREKPSV